MNKFCVKFGISLCLLLLGVLLRFSAFAVQQEPVQSSLPDLVFSSQLADTDLETEVSDLFLSAAAPVGCSELIKADEVNIYEEDEDKFASFQKNKSDQYHFAVPFSDVRSIALQKNQNGISGDYSSIFLSTKKYLQIQVFRI